MMTKHVFYDVILTEIITLNDLVKRFNFKRKDGKPLPPFSGGAHIILEINDNGVLRKNPYSLMSSPSDTTTYSISVRRDDQGRGGSLFLHNQLKTDTPMRISAPVNLFPLDWRATKHLMIAGGIGITPFIPQMEQLTAASKQFELHYATKSNALASYADQIQNRFPTQSHLYYDDDQQSIDLNQLLKKQPSGTHLYICGPKGMINWVKDTAYRYGWPKESIHYEEFLAPIPGKPFQVILEKSHKSFVVDEHQSLLEAIEATGIEPPYMCRGGACGQCETQVLSHEGELIHHDQWLTKQERQDGQKIMPCVSRCSGSSLVLNL